MQIRKIMNGEQGVTLTKMPRNVAPNEEEINCTEMMKYTLETLRNTNIGNQDLYEEIKAHHVKGASNKRKAELVQILIDHYEKVHKEKLLIKEKRKKKRHKHP